MKAIPEGRDRWQSAVLVWVVGGLLLMGCFPTAFLLVSRPHSRSAHFAFWAGLVSLTFGLLVWALRAATPSAAFFGALICFESNVWTGRTDLPLYRSGLAPLAALFVVTHLAGKVGRRKIRAAAERPSTIQGVADEIEGRRGRSASQVLANLGAAGLLFMVAECDFLHALKLRGGAVIGVDLLLKVVLSGVLAEATADTVSSEIGAAFGGQPFLVTRFRKVEAGTDGAVSVVGTAAGCAGAALVVGVGVWSMGLSGREGLAAFAGGVVGLFFDSLLGATVERRGWVGNDWVNFSSTVVGGLVAWVLLLV